MVDDDYAFWWAIVTIVLALMIGMMIGYNTGISNNEIAYNQYCKSLDNSKYVVIESTPYCVNDDNYIQRIDWLMSVKGD